MYGGGRASNYGDDFRSVAGDDLRIAGDRMSCRGSVVGGDSRTSVARKRDYERSA